MESARNSASTSHTCNGTLQTEQAQMAYEVRSMIDRIGYSRSDMIPILQAIQEKYRYLPETALRTVADSLNMSLATIYGVATFYAQFSLEPKGRHIIRVCNGTACHVRGANSLLEGIRSKLNLSEQQNTTDDGLFSLELLSCLGACGLAPVVLVDDKVHGQLTPDMMNKVIDEIAHQDEPLQVTKAGGGQ